MLYVIFLFLKNEQQVSPLSPCGLLEKLIYSLHFFYYRFLYMKKNEQQAKYIKQRS